MKRQQLLPRSIDHHRRFRRHHELLQVSLLSYVLSKRRCCCRLLALWVDFSVSILPASRYSIGTGMGRFALTRRYQVKLAVLRGFLSSLMRTTYLESFFFDPRRLFLTLRVCWYMLDTLNRSDPLTDSIQSLDEYQDAHPLINH